MIATKMLERIPSATSAIRPLAELMMAFESLGNCCEFGMVQRTIGAEPLGLFRFAGSSIANLTYVLERGLEGFLVPEDVALDVRASEFCSFSRSYRDFYTHTHAYVGRDDEAAVLQREVKKAGYLKQRFMSDWSEAQRVYVHCGCEDETAILRLLAALHTHSRCVLLWVVKARHPEERGRVVSLGPHLLKGYLAHYGTFVSGARVDLPGWASIVRAADAIVRGLPEPSVPVSRPLAARFEWQQAFCGVVEASPDLARCRMFHETIFSVPVVKLCLTTPIARNTSVVFSVWISLSATFQHRDMTLTSDDAETVNVHQADASVFEEWQQIWLAMKVIEAKEQIVVSFNAKVAKGAEFCLGGWQLEEGMVPSERTRPEASTVWLTHGTSAATPTATRQRHPLRRKLRALLSSVLLRASRAVLAKDDNAPSRQAPETAHELLSLGDALMHAGCFDAADTVLSAGTILYPWKAELFSHRALCAEMAQAHPEAISRWREMVCFFPQVALGHHRLSAALRKSGSVGEALLVVEAALAAHGGDVAIVAEAARTFAAARRWPEAVKHWDQALAKAGHPDWSGEREHAESMARLSQRRLAD